MDQRTLFDLPRVPTLDDLGPDATHEERASAFRHAHPEVYAEFVRRARVVADSGRTHYSPRAIWEAMRYHFDFERADDEPVRLNNNYVAFFSRWSMDDGHVPAGFFQTRCR